MAFGEEETHTGRMKDTLESASLKTYREREKEGRGKVGRAGRGIGRGTFFMGNPCLSFPPVTLNTYPLNSSPIESPATSWPIYPASAQVLSTCCCCRGRYSLVHECPQTTLIFDFDEFLGAIGRVSNLHALAHCLRRETAREGTLSFILLGGQLC